MITVIADDFTGAAEIAGICLRYGIDVAFGIDVVPENNALISVIATDSRSLSEDEAYNIHLQLVSKVLKRNSNQMIFKKCDSVLRGHILVELKATMKATEKNKVILQPANPTGGRFIEKGVYYVEGIEIGKTGFVNDPDFPAKTSSVKELLLNRTKNHAFKADNIHLEGFNDLESDGIYISDCNCESDLIKALEYFEKSTCLVAGSAAFFEQFLIKNQLSLKNNSKSHQESFENYFLVSGSIHPNSVKFASELKQKGCPVLLFPDYFLEKELEENRFKSWISLIEKELDSVGKAVLRVSNQVVKFENSSLLLKQRLSRVVKEVINRTRVEEIFIEGGATAYNILKTLGWNEFVPLTELSPGVVRLKKKNEEVYITVKPGSYQWPKGLLQ
ncbi:four-carbon acid sugar kinase family protein [Aestuariibaculum lutulentum]|uniref:Four-carbon acid sugar kinase family protein n=1 Tax=Aestuariibaculum lutulentum TaxID=2920935 RepID=A0ABS9RFI1_9FLAO|nr:four-carbon acid sugar kinase family protein [Aestuariibaculum lutulentum]MCH4551699.1 four-carbon acid sugar kinase family protein [Aestuariibaculum lutulentum]